MKRAAVLGSGGIIGVAWLTGVVEGLLEAGVDLTEADTLVGTSAGSLVSSMRVTTPGANAPASSDAPPDRSVLMGGVTPEVAREVFMTWASLQGPDPKAAARIGALARTNEKDGELLVQVYERMLGDPDWPAVDLRLVTVDTETGERAVHRAGGDVRVARAVAASTAVPAMSPPVRIGASLHMDGGVHSTTHVDLLVGEGFECVVIAAPTNEVTGRSLGTVAERCLEAELARLRGEGVRVEVLMPEEADKAAYGRGLMDATHAPQAQAAGRAQALREAERIASIWKA